MADNTKIEWSDATWNPIVGCSVVSPGCTNCYAMKLAGTRMKHHHSRQGLTIDTKAGPVWNGEVRFMEEWLDQPLRWAKPREIFVCAHGDLFFEKVPDEWIDRVFAVMALAPQHRFQVLTKRSARMRAYISGLPARRAELDCHAGLDWATWPLPNVWLGVSAEDQKRADERIPDLLATPAAVRWVSAEPLLGPIDVDRWLDRTANGRFHAEPILDWIVAGGESGPKARPMHPQWARDIREQCSAAGVAFFFKQWGEWAPATDPEGAVRSEGHGREGAVLEDGRWVTFKRGDRHGDVFRLGKKRAGRLLDGRTHDAMPGARP